MTFTGFFVFGDSLVDAGNALGLADFYGDLTFSDLPNGSPDPELGYFDGRFADGYTFADLLANKFVGAVTEPIFPYGYEDPWLGVPIAPWESDPQGNSLNFAYGGAQVLQGDEVVPDLDGQTDAFKSAVDGNPDPTALYLVTMGGNDVRSLVPTGSNPVPEAQAHAALDAVAQQLINELGGLVALGVENILLTGIPDVGLIPNYDVDGNLVLDAAEQMRADTATQYSIYLDTLLRTEVVPALEALGATVTYVPLMDYVDENGNEVIGALTANLPTLAALNGLTADELLGNMLEHQDVVFFDDIHPNAQAHALLGAFIHSQMAGTAWVETLPLTGSDVDYSMTGTIATAGEVDTVTIAMVAGTTYRFDLLGVSSLGTAGTLGDPSLALSGSGSSILASDDDSGAGFDSTLSFTASRSGNHTVALSGVGSLTGSYVFQGAVVSGAAMLSGNVYVIGNSSVLVLEAAGGTGLDVVKASVSYALAQGSEVEQLRTTKDSGTAALDLTGNEFGQSITGNAGANSISGLAGNDSLYGLAGNDRLDGGAGADTMDGGAGNDIYYVDSGSDVVVENSHQGGDDTIHSSVSYSLASRYVETLTLTGSAAINATGNNLANTLNGNSGANVLTGLAGDDSLDGGAGADVMDGGGGNDIYFVDNASDLVVEISHQGGDDLIYSSVSYSLANRYVETLVLTGSSALNATGNNLANTLTGNSGSNLLTGLAGDDRLDGGAGADTMDGGGGNDAYFVDNSSDLVIETSAQGGTDTIYSSVGYSLVGRYVETLVLTGSSAVNATGNNLANTLHGNSASNVLTGGTGADKFVFDTALNALTNVDSIADFSATDDTIVLDDDIFTALGAPGALASSAFVAGAVAADADDRIIYDSLTGNIYYDADGSGGGAQVLFAQVSPSTAITYADFLIGG